MYWTDTHILPYSAVYQDDLADQAVGALIFPSTYGLFDGVDLLLCAMYVAKFSPLDIQGYFLLMLCYGTIFYRMKIFCILDNIFNVNEELHHVNNGGLLCRLAYDINSQEVPE